MTTDNASISSSSSLPKTKIFVGNLSFNTKESDLDKFLSPIGEIKNVSIITRRGRSLGYGFVTFEKEQDAAKAVKSMDKQELNERPINVQLADESRRPSYNPSGNTGASAGEQNEDLDDETKGEHRDSRGHRGTRGGRRFRGSRGGSRGAHRSRSTNDKSEEPAGEPSPTSLFVGNLPWKFDEDALKNLFSNHNVASVRIIRRFNGLSKGFGFVEFATHQDQQNAINELKDKDVEIESRNISIRVAIEKSKQSNSDNAENEDNTVYA